MKLSRSGKFCVAALLFPLSHSALASGSVDVGDAYKLFASYIFPFVAIAVALALSCIKTEDSWFVRLCTLWFQVYFGLVLSCGVWVALVSMMKQLLSRSALEWAGLFVWPCLFIAIIFGLCAPMWMKLNTTVKDPSPK
jgi:hypothetical protein